MASHDGDTFGMDSEKGCILKKTHLHGKSCVSMMGTVARKDVHPVSILSMELFDELGLESTQDERSTGGMLVRTMYASVASCRASTARISAR